VHNSTIAFEDDQVSDRHTTALRRLSGRAAAVVKFEA
jgi:hypothetical protein